MLGVGNDWGRGNGARNERSKAIARATFRVGSIKKPPTFMPSATNQASATGENPCVHQSYFGREDGVALGLCAEWRTKCRCLALQVGMASGGVGLAAEWSGPTPRRRSGGGGKRERSRQRECDCLGSHEWRAGSLRRLGMTLPELPCGACGERGVSGRHITLSLRQPQRFLVDNGAKRNRRPKML